MLDLPTNTFNAYKLIGSLLAIMDLQKCHMKSSVKLKNQLKTYFNQDLFLDLPQALTTKLATKHSKYNHEVLNQTPYNLIG